MPKVACIGDIDVHRRRSAADLFDGAAMLCSGACMAHCLVPPVLLLALPG